jgi:hypothetical protein
MAGEHPYRIAPSADVAPSVHRLAVDLFRRYAQVPAIALTPTSVEEVTPRA